MSSPALGASRTTLEPPCSASTGLAAGFGVLLTNGMREASSAAPPTLTTALTTIAAPTPGRSRVVRLVAVDVHRFAHALLGSSRYQSLLSSPIYATRSWLGEVAKTSATPW